MTFDLIPIEETGLYNPAIGRTPSRAFIHVDYEEFKPETYRGVVIRPPIGSSDPIQKICTGNGFEADLRKAVQIAIEQHGGCWIGSGVDNYCMDSGERYDFLFE